MQNISVIIDCNLVQRSVFGMVAPLTEKDVTGITAWAFTDDEMTQSIIKDSLSRCVTLGEPVAYRVRIPIPNGKLTLFSVRAKRVVIGSERLIHCVCTSLPPLASEITLSERDFLELLLQCNEMKTLASILKITSSAVSQRIAALKRKLQIESSYELREIAKVLHDERQWNWR